jgi:molybdate transport system regulatory protein
MARLSIRIDFEPSGSMFGPGMAELLERIGKLGSIRKAAASMKMSYRKAWLQARQDLPGYRSGRCPRRRA